MAESSESSRVYVGRLVEHGPAPFENDPENQQSYFARLRTQEGDRTVWGVDLQRAIRDGRAQVGDDIAIEYKGREAVPVSVTERDAAGRATGRHEITANRNRWRVTVRQTPLEEVAITPRSGTGGLPVWCVTISVSSYPRMTAGASDRGKDRVCFGEQQLVVEIARRRLARIGID